MTIGDEHHYFPRKFLENFFGKKNGIHFYDKDANKIIENRNITSIAKEKYLYSVQYNGTKNNSLENEFQKIEDYIFPTLKKITDGVKPVYQEEISSLIQFSILLSLRTPTIVDMANNVLREERVYESVIDSIIENGVSNELAQGFGNLLLSNKGMSYLHALPYLFEQRCKLALENYRIVLLTCFRSYPKFILGDTYMACNWIEPYDPSLENFEIFRQQTEIIFPVSQNVCILLSPTKNEEDKGAVSRKELTIDEIFRLNNIIVHQSNRYMFSGCLLELKRISSIK